MSEPQILESALLLAQLGMAVHWLRAPRGGELAGRGKAPIDKRWQLLPCRSPQQLRATHRTGLNLGIHTGHVTGARLHLVAVDWDDEPALLWCLGHLPPTPLAAMSRKGGHFYYLRPSTLHVPSRAKVGGMALEVRADGGNIVAPPSIHPGGTVYRWVRPPESVELLKLPVYRCEWLPAPPPAAPVSVPVLTASAGGAEPLRRARAYTRGVPGAVSGQGGSLATFKLAVALVRGFALPEEQALGVLLEDFNPRCEPPWSEEELRHKVSYARKAGRVAMGSLLGVGR